MQSSKLCMSEPSADCAQCKRSGGSGRGRLTQLQRTPHPSQGYCLPRCCPSSAGPSSAEPNRHSDKTCRQVSTFAGCHIATILWRYDASAPHYCCLNKTSIICIRVHYLCVPGCKRAPLMLQKKESLIAASLRAFSLHWILYVLAYLQLFVSTYFALRNQTGITGKPNEDQLVP